MQGRNLAKQQSFDSILFFQQSNNKLIKGDLLELYVITVYV
jgi:hypothetical protein